MKTLFYTLMAGSLLLLSFTACSNDKGNYDYLSENELIPVEISAIDSVSVKANSLLSITPTVKNDNKLHYKYTWYTIAKVWPYKRDTLSTQHDLSFNCNLSAGEYILYYQVKDSLKNIYKYVSTPLTVTATDINSGWYVMKEENGMTDVDYFPMNNGAVRPNLLVNAVGISPLIGSPVGIVYGSSCYNQELTNSDGSVTMLYNQSIIHIVSTKDMITLNASDMSVFKKLSDEFYETPSNINFQTIAIDPMQTQSLINNGQMHDLLSGAGVGKFSYQKSGNFKFFPKVISGKYDNYVYDQNSSSMYDSMFGTFFQCARLSGSTIFADSSFVMLNFMPRVENTYMSSAYAVFRGGLKNKYYVSSIGLYSNYLYPDPTFSEIPSTCGLLSADVMAAPRSASVIYFAKDNVLRLFKVAYTSEETLKTFDSGEKITFIKNISGTNLDGTTCNDLVVITNSSGGYKVYRFPLVGSAGEIDASSSAVMTGTGAANFIMFRQS